MQAWFSKLCYHKHVFACVAVEMIKCAAPTCHASAVIPPARHDDPVVAVAIMIVPAPGSAPDLRDASLEDHPLAALRLQLRAHLSTLHPRLHRRRRVVLLNKQQNTTYINIIITIIIIIIDIIIIIIIIVTIIIIIINIIITTIILLSLKSLLS